MQQNPIRLADGVFAVHTDEKTTRSMEGTTMEDDERPNDTRFSPAKSLVILVCTLLVIWGLITGGIALIAW